MKEFFGAILGNSLVLLVIAGVPVLSLIFLPYDYGMPLILLWVGSLVLLWIVFVLRAMARRGKSGSQDEDAS